MKLFWFSLTTFYAIIHQKHLAITAVDPEDDPSALTPTQNEFMVKLGDQIINILKSEVDIIRTDLEIDDERPVENQRNIVRDDLLEGTLLMHDVVIDGLDEIEEDDISTAVDESKLQVRMAVNLKKLVILGEYSVETPNIGVDEKWPFSVTLTNVRIEDVAYLLEDPSGAFQISKLVPTILSEESQTWLKSKTAPVGSILKMALTHLELTVKKRFARVATLEILMSLSKSVPQNPPSAALKAIFAAQTFVNQRYDPYRFRFEDRHQSPEWNLSPVTLHGFSKFRQVENVMSVSNTSVSIILRIVVNDLHGDFSFFRHQANLATYSVGKMEFIGKMTLTVDNVIIENLGMEMSNCRCSVRNKATGKPADRNELDFDADETFCLILRNAISTKRIINAIQSEICNHVNLKALASSFYRVIQENNYMEA